MSLIKEFREFAVKGNMVDMAVGIIIGVAFATVVNSLVNDIFTPIISGIFNIPDMSNLFILVKAPENPEGVNMESLQAVRDAGGAAIGYGSFINAIIAFLLVAWALFLVIKGINRLKRKEEAAPAPEAPKGPTQEELLMDIRDLLRRQTQTPKV